MGQALERAIALLTEGYSVDWEGLLDDATDDAERIQISELRGLAQLDAEEFGYEHRPADGTVGVSAPGVNTAPRRWGQLELLNEIGRGSSGSVFRAWDTRLAREVALKLLTNDGLAGDIDEARRLARVTHPNVVVVHGADRVDGQVGLWMELLRGRTLEEVLLDQGPFSSREATLIALEICGALSAIHASGLVHRDIKTQNIMREPGGRLVLMDMGAGAEVSFDEAAIGSMAGTPLYMAPELFGGAQATPSTEIYAIGVLLYRLVTGTFPIEANTVGDVRRAHATSALRPLREVRPNLPGSYVALVDRCLAHDAGSRFPSIAALERALRRNDASVASTIAGRTRTAWTAAIALVACALSVALGWSYRSSILARPTAPTAPTYLISPDQARVFAGYEELALSKRPDDPAGAAAAINNAVQLIRPVLPGNQPFYGLLYAQMTSLWRKAGDLQKANANALDGGANMNYSVGEENPFTAVLAMELARNAQAAGDHHTAAEQIRRALEIRWRVLNLSTTTQQTPSLPNIGALERSSHMESSETDTDGDGLLDVVELATGLNPRSMDSDGDGVIDDDELTDGFVVSNRLALGLVAFPLLNWAHYGAQEPRTLGWQSPARFPMIERPQPVPPGWAMETSSQGYFTQLLSRPHSTRAIQAGFSILVRAMPVEGGGLVSIVVDTAPAGPRFDLMFRRVNPREVEIMLPSSIVPREGRVLLLESSVEGPGLLLELRYRPQWATASLYANGRRLSEGYLGHHQFQDLSEGGVTWGVFAPGTPNSQAKAAFQLVWLEIF